MAVFVIYPAISASRGQRGVPMDLEPVASEPGAERRVAFPCEDCGQEITLSSRLCGRVEVCPHCGGFVDVPGVADAHLSDVPPEPTGNLASGSDRQPTDGAAKLPRLPAAMAIAVVLCLAVVPDFFNSLRSLGIPNDSSFASGALHIIVRSFQVSMPLLAIVFLSQSDWKEFGIDRPRWVLDSVVGIALWGASTVFATSIMALALRWDGASAIAAAPGTMSRPQGAADFFLLLIACAANGFAE